jgi:uncharacterized membrane protein YhaH (DUF805 family)
VSFQDAVTTVYTQKYADFSGRARRSEFWFGYLAYFLVAVVANILSAVLGTKIPLYLVFLAAVVPILAAAARRLHDTGRSAAWLLLILTVIGVIPLIVFLALDGQPGDNQYGPSPKGAELNPAPNATWGQS